MKKYLFIFLLLNTAYAVDVVRIDWDDSLENSSAFYDRVDTTSAVIPKADSSSFNFNPLFLSGGFYRDELNIKVRADDGTAYMVIDNEYDPGGSTDIWLSTDGEGGRDGGLVEMYSFDLPDSVALSAGSATTVTNNYVYITYDDDAGGVPILIRHGAQDQIGVRGDLLDSMIFVGSAGLGAVSGDDVTVRYFNVDQPSLYKNPLRTTLHGYHASYHSGIDITAEAGSHTFSHLRGFVHSGTDNNLISPFSTESSALRVPVYGDSNYATWDSLDNFDSYSDGTLGDPKPIGNAHYFWVVLWGAISNDTTQYQLYMNIQASTNTYLTLAQVRQDEDNMKPTTIPDDYHDTGFLIAALIIRKSNNEIQIFADGSTFLDLRGFVSGTKGGGGAPPTDSVQIDAWNFLLPPIDLTSEVTGTLPIANGGTGETDLDDIVPGTNIVIGNGANSVIGGDVTISVNWVGAILDLFNEQTPWSIFYSNGAGDVSELAIGSSGQYLKSTSTFNVPTWDTPTGLGMPAADFNDSLESQVEFSPNWSQRVDSSFAVYTRIDTTTAKIPTATLADSTNGGAIRSETCKEADSTDGGAARATTSAVADSTDGGSIRSETCKIADSCDGGAARAEVSDSTNSPFRAAAHDTLFAHYGYSYVLLNQTHGASSIGRDDDVFLTLEQEKDMIPYLWVDSSVTGATFDTVIVTCLMPDAVTIDSLIFVYILDDADIDSISIIGPDRSNGLGICDSVYQTITTGWSSESAVRIGIDLTDISATGGESFGVVFHNAFDATGDMIKLYKAYFGVIEL